MKNVGLTEHAGLKGVGVVATRILVSELLLVCSDKEYSKSHQSYKRMTKPTKKTRASREPTQLEQSKHMSGKNLKPEFLEQLHNL
jgi:hypothetical protein